MEDGSSKAFVVRSLIGSFDNPTTEYAHGVLGDSVEYKKLVVGYSIEGSKHVICNYDPRGVLANGPVTTVLPEGRVFEDLEPRVFSLVSEQDSSTIYKYANHVAVVESSSDAGAQLAVYAPDVEGGLTKIAATPHIGQRNRWLAPAGIADFDGDGQNDIAYVETPHLGKILKIVTLKGDQLVPIVEPQPGFSNHKIGQDFITSGVRNCNGRTELLTPDSGWNALISVWVEDGNLVWDKTKYKPSLVGIEQAKRCE